MHRQLRFSLVAIVLLVGTIASCSTETKQSWTEWSHSPTALKKARSLSNSSNLGTSLVANTNLLRRSPSSALDFPLEYFALNGATLGSHDATCFIKELIGKRQFEPPITTEQISLTLLNRAAINSPALDMNDRLEAAFIRKAHRDKQLKRFIKDGSVRMPTRDELLADRSRTATYQDIEDFDQTLNELTDTTPASRFFTLAKQIVQNSAAGKCPSTSLEYESQAIRTYALFMLEDTNAQTRQQIEGFAQEVPGIDEGGENSRRKRFLQGGELVSPVANERMPNGKAATATDVQDFGLLIVEAIKNNEGEAIVGSEFQRLTIAISTFNFTLHAHVRSLER